MVRQLQCVCNVYKLDYRTNYPLFCFRVYTYRYAAHFTDLLVDMLAAPVLQVEASGLQIGFHSSDWFVVALSQLKIPGCIYIYNCSIYINLYL